MAGGGVWVRAWVCCKGAPEGWGGAATGRAGVWVRTRVEVHHSNSSRKARSIARAECVMAPDETKSAPVSA